MESFRMTSALRQRLQSVRVLVCDVDGTLTDGSVTFTATGDELKTFNVHDGLGISVALRHGLEIVFMTGRRSQMVERRAKELGVTVVSQGISNKRDAIEAMSVSMNLAMDAIAYIGDDLNDVPAMERAGFVFAVNDACEFVCRNADHVLSKGGGHGAVREAIELILDAKVGLATVIDEYIKSAYTTANKSIMQ
jgi:3-deoxy-D-manno-octulosonate 8-phosphate phosphatase (KDO 8-P phosphatase)